MDDGRVVLGDICKVIDCPHKTAPAADGLTELYSIGTKDLKRGRLALASAKQVSRETYEEWTARAVPSSGELILGREAPVGGVAMVPSDVPVCLGQRTVLLQPDDERIVPRYLLYLLLSDEVQVLMHRLSAGSTVAHLNVLDIRQLRIPLRHNLAEQEAIARFLGALDDKVERNAHYSRALERIVAALFRSALVEFDQAAELVDSPIGPIPSGWRLTRLDEVVESVRNQVALDSLNEDEPYIGLDVMPRGSTVLAEWGRREDVSGSTLAFRQGDILFGKLRPYFKKVGVAPVDGSASTEIVVLRPRSPELFLPAIGHLSSQEFIDHCNAISTGTRMPRAEWNSAGQFLVPLPLEASALAELSELARTIYDRIILLSHESRALMAMRDTLIPKLISGELGAPPADSSEVTSSLTDGGVPVA
jgi:type I restriction enzyme S subunit